MADETFGINNDQTPPSTSDSGNPMETLVTPTPETPAPETPAPDIDKELEKQLAEVPATTEKPTKKLPIKILAIIFVLLLGGGAIAYFFLGMSSNSAEEVVVNDPPPSFPNPFASSDEPEEETIPTEEDIPTADAPPSLNFPSMGPEDSAIPAVSEEFVETVENLKETSDAAANLTETPLIEDVPEKISR